MISSRHNVSVDEARDQFRALLEHCPDSSLDLRAAYQANENGDWCFVLGKCITQEGSSDDHDERYPRHAFVSRHLSSDSQRSFWTDLCGKGFDMGPDLPRLQALESQSNVTEVVVPSHASLGEYPQRQFFVDITTNSHFADTKLLAHSMPFRASAQAYVLEFLELNRFHGQNDGDKGKLIVEVEDRRGAIRLAEDRISVVGNHDNLYLVGQINDEKPFQLVAGENRSVDLESVYDLELWLLNLDNSVLDYYSSTEWPYPYPGTPQGVDARSILYDLVAQGESVRCEFKPYIDLNDKHKSSEIEKSVCAFSNANGGTLFLGIDDDGETVGISKEVHKTYGSGLDEAITRYTNAIQKRMRERLYDNQCFDVAIAELYGCVVVTVTVTPSARVNYLTHSKQAFIRRGATNQRMSPDDITGYSRTQFEY